MTAETGEGVEIQVTEDDIAEARRLGLTGSQMLARAIRRQHPEAVRVRVDVDAGTIEVETGKPLD